MDTGGLATEYKRMDIVWAFAVHSRGRQQKRQQKSFHPSRIEMLGVVVDWLGVI